MGGGIGVERRDVRKESSSFYLPMQHCVPQLVSNNFDSGHTGAHAYTHASIHTLTLDIEHSNILD